jgi:glycosyltransferase involved in cell wall biosynthesis
MKIAVVDHFGNTGGGSRVVHSLIPAIKRANPNNEITYFGGRDAIARELYIEQFTKNGIEVRYLSSLRIKLGKTINSEIYFRVKSQIKSRLMKSLLTLIENLIESSLFNISKEIERKTSGFDLIFFPWPFHIDCPKTYKPMVGIFHDFNHKYYFSGAHTFSINSRKNAEKRMPDWLNKCTPVVSSNFIADELKKFYSFAEKKVNVIHLPRLNDDAHLDPKVAGSIVKKMGITDRYLLYPTHMVSHKNIGPLIAAVQILNSQNYFIKLVLTGAGTNTVKGVATSIGVELNDEYYDVIGLGYVTNLEINSLIACASVVINCSLYEAGNGSGVDAWAYGTPVAMSNIPSFLENLSVLDVRALVFDPRSPEDIANKIAFILDYPERIKSDVAHSVNSMTKINWDQVGNSYLRVFENVVNSPGNHPLG